MALPEREISPYNQVLKLFDQLSTDELAKLRKKIDSKSWSTRWRALFTEVDEQNKNLPPLSDAEIAAEVDAVREEMKAKRAQ
jgi:Ca2+-binding EF-hand superfamily protein